MAKGIAWLKTRWLLGGKELIAWVPDGGYKRNIMSPIYQDGLKWGTLENLPSGKKKKYLISQILVS